MKHAILQVTGLLVGSLVIGSCFAVGLLACGASPCADPVTPNIEASMAQCLNAPYGSFSACLPATAERFGIPVAQVNDVWSGHVAAEVAEGFVPKPYPVPTPTAQGRSQ